MKVLVTYFSQTGNTEAIAKAIQDEAATSHDVQSKNIEEVQPETCQDYDIVFVGSPIHASNLAGPVTSFMNSLPQSPNFKIAGFVTHSSPCFETTSFQNGLTTFETVTKEKGIDLRGCFECQGRMTSALHDMVKQARGLSDEQFSEMMAEADKHPGSEDEQKAKEFARNILSST